MVWWKILVQDFIQYHLLPCPWPECQGLWLIKLKICIWCWTSARSGKQSHQATGLIHSFICFFGSGFGSFVCLFIHSFLLSWLSLFKCIIITHNLISLGCFGYLFFSLFFCIFYISQVKWNSFEIAIKPLSHHHHYHHPNPSHHQY